MKDSSGIEHSAEDVLTDAEYDLITNNHIALVAKMLKKVVDDLQKRALVHDSDKLCNEERELFKKYTPLLGSVEYGGQKYHEYRGLLGTALKAHYAKAPHHPEHHDRGVEGMTLVDLLEMACDWCASSKRNKNGNAVRSVEINKWRFWLDDQLVSILINTVKWLEGTENGR